MLFVLHISPLPRLRLRRLVDDEKAGTARQESSVTEQRNALRVKIRSWQKIQPIYMPGLLSLQHNLMADHPSTTTGANQSEHIPLWLPSSLSSENRRVACVANVVEFEEKLRTAQCYDLLEKIRHVLRMKSRMVLFKNKNIRGQAAGTRSRTVINRVQDRAKYLTRHYCIARLAKLSLSGPGDWEHHLRELKDGDVRSYQDPDRLKKSKGRRGTFEDDQLVGNAEAVDEGDAGVDLIAEARNRRDGTGETRRTLSWIWLVERSDGTNEGGGSGSTDDILRAEWAKSRARATRATEEVLMLREEMRRLIEFLNWKARWWTVRQTLRPVNNSALQEGLLSYAIKQARVQRELSSLAQGLFKTPLEEMGSLDSMGGDDGEDDDEENITSSVGDDEDEEEEGFEGCDDEDDEDE